MMISEWYAEEVDPEALEVFVRADAFQSIDCCDRVCDFSALREVRDLLSKAGTGSTDAAHQALALCSATVLLASFYGNSQHPTNLVDHVHDVCKEAVAVSLQLLRTTLERVHSKRQFEDGKAVDKEIGLLHSITALVTLVAQWVALLDPHSRTRRDDAFLAALCACGMLATCVDSEARLHIQDILAPSAPESLHLLARRSPLPSEQEDVDFTEDWLLPQELRAAYCSTLAESIYSGSLPEEAARWCAALRLRWRALLPQDRSLLVAPIARWAHGDKGGLVARWAAVCLVELELDAGSPAVWMTALPTALSLLDAPTVSAQMGGLLLVRALVERSTTAALVVIVPSTAAELLSSYRMNSDPWPRMLCGRLLQALSCASSRDPHCVMLLKELVADLCRTIRAEFSPGRSWPSLLLLLCALRACEGCPEVLCGLASGVLSAVSHCLSVAAVPVASVHVLALRALHVVHRVMPGAWTDLRLVVASDLLRLALLYKSLGEFASAEASPPVGQQEEVQRWARMCWVEFACQDVCATADLALFMSLLEAPVAL